MLNLIVLSLIGITFSILAVIGIKLFVNSPKSLVSIIFIMAFFLFGVIYWLDIPGALKYIVFIIFTLAIIGLSKNKTKIDNTIRIILFFYLAVISFFSLLAEGINASFFQSFFGLLFLFAPVVIFAKIEWNEKLLYSTIKLIFILFFIQITIASYQSFILKLPFDRITGSLGRAETTTVSILGGIIFSIALSISVFYQEKTILILTTLGTTYFFIIAEAKAGFFFVAFSLLLFIVVFRKSKYSSLKIITYFCAFLLISYISFFVIMPSLFGTELAANILSNTESLSDYMGKNYGERDVRFAAIVNVFYEYLNNSWAFWLGNGLGSFSISALTGETTAAPRMFYFYSMATEVVIYLIQGCLIGTLIFVFSHLFLAKYAYKILKQNNNKLIKIISYLFINCDLIMIISFLVYCRPFKVLLLTVFTYGLLGLLIHLNQNPVFNEN